MQKNSEVFLCDDSQYTNLMMIDMLMKRHAEASISGSLFLNLCFSYTQSKSFLALSSHLLGEGKCSTMLLIWILAFAKSSARVLMVKPIAILAPPINNNS
jgi:hypothetical protein